MTLKDFTQGFLHKHLAEFPSESTSLTCVFNVMHATYYFYEGDKVTLLYHTARALEERIRFLEEEIAAQRQLMGRIQTFAKESQSLSDWYTTIANTREKP